jgi:integrase
VRERKLSDDELRALWSIDPEPYATLLKFALLTATRIGDAINFAPERVVDGVWHIAMTKSGRPHAVPLSPTAAALAAQGWSRRAYTSLHAHPVANGIGWRPHDLRRTAATKMAGAGVPSDAIEAVLDHSRPKLLRTYQQPDPLPAMHDALAKLDAAIVRPA